MEAGADTYATKPISRATLRRLVDVWAKREPSDTSEPTDAASVRIDFEIDPELQDLIPGYVANCLEDLRKIEPLVDQGDFESVAGLGHNLKGSGRAYGFARISEIGAALEGESRASSRAGVLRSAHELIAYLEAVEMKLRKTQ